MEEKKLTGYPSIDKPQYRFYSKKPARVIDAEQTIYDLVFHANRENMNAPALEYMGSEWTFARLKREANRIADAFAKAGLKLGDTVLLGVSNCPEAVATLLALNKLGAVSKWFDVRAGEKDIEDYANDSSCRYIIAFDMLLPKIRAILDNTAVEKVLVIHPTDSLPVFVRALYAIKAKHLPKDQRYLRFSHFIKNGDPNSDIPCVPFDRNRPAIMVQSSGTTGKPKTIVHSDYSAAVSVKEVAYWDFTVRPGVTVLDALPPWIAYAIGQAIIQTLSLGAKVRLCPTFEPDTVMKHLGGFTLAYAAPFHYRHIRDHFDQLTAKQQNGLKKMKCLVSGGDKMSIEENKELERILGVVVVNGYGSNEGWGCLTVNPTKHNKYGTVGTPKRGDTIIAYDEERGELPYGEIGEICVHTKTMFLYYEGNPTETDAVKKLHPDGKVWLHTGDLGYVDEDGFVTLCGRARRVIVRQGFKISAAAIEDKISEHPAVRECVAVEVKDPVEAGVPMAYIILKDGTNDIEAMKQSIYDLCHAELKENEIPKYFKVVTELPYTQNGKYNFRLLEKLGNEIAEAQG